MSPGNFVSCKDLRKEKGQNQNKKAKNLEYIVPYNFSERECFLCKEKIECILDDDDDMWYFLDAKRIKIKTSEGRKIKTVHVDCIKQLDLVWNHNIEENHKETEDEEMVVSQKHGPDLNTQ